MTTRYLGRDALILQRMARLGKGVLRLDAMSTAYSIYERDSWFIGSFGECLDGMSAPFTVSSMIGNQAEVHDKSTYLLCGTAKRKSTMALTGAI